jgi:hypothetical protein
MIKHLRREDHLRLQACNGPATCRYSTDPQELITHSADGNGREIQLRSASVFCSSLSETRRRTCCHRARPRVFTGLMLGLSTWRVVTLLGEFLTLQGSDLRNASSIMTVRGVWKLVSFLQCTLFPPGPTQCIAMQLVSTSRMNYVISMAPRGSTLVRICYYTAVIDLGKPRIVITGVTVVNHDDLQRPLITTSRSILSLAS